LRGDFGQVSAGADRLREFEREFLGRTVLQAFKNNVLQAVERLRDTNSFSARMIAVEKFLSHCVIDRINGTPDRAALPGVPIRSLDNLVGLVMRSERFQEFHLQLRITVISNHLCLLDWRLGFGHLALLVISPCIPISQVPN